MSSEIEYLRLVKRLTSSHDAVAAQLFGKKCIKVNGKACVALFNNCIVFKLTDPEHKKAFALAGSVLWDTSGKGRAMKEWLQITLVHQSKFNAFAKAAADYVG